MTHEILKWLVVGYFSLILFWIFRMISNFRRRMRLKRKNVISFKLVDKRDDPVFKATYNPKEFRRPRD